MKLGPVGRDRSAKTKGLPDGGPWLVLVTDPHGLPLGYRLVPANEKEYEPLAGLLSGVPAEVVVGDKSCGAEATRLGSPQAGSSCSVQVWVQLAAKRDPTLVAGVRLATAILRQHGFESRMRLSPAHGHVNRMVAWTCVPDVSRMRTWCRAGADLGCSL
jgi:hypothetical protein